MVQMIIKWKTLLKGFVWETVGFIILFLIAWFTTGTAVMASITSLLYTGFRAITFYPFERLFKRVTRWYYYKTGQR